MKAVVLAAGVSSRLRPITDTIPKSLLKIGGITLIERNIQHLHSKDIKDITIVVGYLKEQIIDVLFVKYPEIKFVENPIYDSSGSGYSLYLGIKSIAGNTDIVFQDADIIYHPGILNGFDQHPGRSIIMVGQNECDAEAVKVTAGEDGKVTRLTKKIAISNDCIGESIGLVKLEMQTVPTVISLCEQQITNANYDFEWEHILDNNFKQMPFFSQTTNLPWIEIDFPHDIEAAEFVAKKI